VGAEYVLGLAPRGTHEWHKFITPQELAHMGAAAGLALEQASGLWYNPLARVWGFTPDLAVNYAAAFSKPWAAAGAGAAAGGGGGRGPPGAP
jgi:2-polyprenyl-3-methyl-5-hydroxy-6-metoxy-1,4-benzoquinol methylase